MMWPTPSASCCSRRRSASLLLVAVVLPLALAAAFGASPTAAAPSSSMREREQRETKAAKKAGPRMHRGLERKTDYVVLETRPHDPKAFTQGLVFEPDGTFLEGTGLYGQSSLRKVDPTTGAPSIDVPLDHKYFGEGIVAVDDRIIQITWKERKALVYGRQNLTYLSAFEYRTTPPHSEGWGITTDGRELIVSDGSATLFFWDKDTYAETRTVAVVDGFGRPVQRLNELEYAYGYVWANIWLADDIVQIDPKDGKVVAFYDFSALYPAGERSNIDQVLNGIAYDEAEDVFWLTGKWWPNTYKVKMCGFNKDGTAEANGVCSVNAQGGKKKD